MEIILDIQDKDERDILKKANKIIMAENQKDYTTRDLISIIDELTWAYDHLEEEFEDYKEMINDNYKPRDPYTMYGVSENDFH